MTFDDCASPGAPPGRTAAHEAGRPRPDAPGRALAVPAIDDDFETVVRRSLALLPDDWRVAIELRDIRGMSAEQAAALMGIRPAAFKRRLHRGRMQLRDLVEPYLDSCA